MNYIDIYDKVYNLYSANLYKYIYTYVGSKETSEDILQDSFICLINKKITFKTDIEYFYYLLKISKNKALDYLRKRKKIRYLEENEKDTITITEEDNDNLNNLLKCIENLDTIYKDVIVLHFYNNLKLEEISKALKISLSAVKMRISRGKEILKKEMEKYENDY